MRKKRWFYLPATDELFEKTGINWTLPYTANAPEVWTVFAKTEAEARKIIHSMETKWVDIK